MVRALFYTPWWYVSGMGAGGSEALLLLLPQISWRPWEKVIGRITGAGGIWEAFAVHLPSGIAIEELFSREQRE